MSGKNNFFAFVSSSPDDFSHDFITHLDKEYQFDASWSVAILQKKTSLVDRHFILMDICTESCINSKSVRMIGSFDSDIINHPIYVPLRNITTKSLNVSIVNKSLDHMQMDDQVELLLHFKRSLF